MRFVLFGNTYQTKKASHIEKLLNTLRRLDCNLFIDASFYHFVKQELGLPFEPDGIFENGDFQADLAISMGGDGTFLKAASRIGNKDIPIVGINTGRLGFLADIMPVRLFVDDMVTKSEFPGISPFLRKIRIRKHSFLISNQKLYLCYKYRIIYRIMGT